MTLSELIEIVWTGVALMGVGYSLKAYTDAAGDLKALQDTKHDWSDEVIANMDRRTCACFLTMLAVFAAVGVGALMQRDEDPVDLSGLVMAVGLIAAVALLVWGIRANRRDRKALLAHEPLTPKHEGG